MRRLIARVLRCFGVNSILGDGVWDDGPGIQDFINNRRVWNVAGVKREPWGTYFPPGKPHYLIKNPINVS